FYVVRAARCGCWERPLAGVIPLCSAGPQTAPHPAVVHTPAAGGVLPSAVGGELFPRRGRMTMQLDEVQTWFAAQEMPFAWRRDLGRPARLMPVGRQLTIGNIQVAIVVPDVHLGWGNDPFTYNDVHHAQRLERFLDKLAALRDTVGANAFTAIQLGDWYDFWRTPPPSIAADRHTIEQHYRSICDKAAVLPLL